jgi:hypothetical protein
MKRIWMAVCLLLTAVVLTLSGGNDSEARRPCTVKHPCSTTTTTQPVTTTTAVPTTTAAPTTTQATTTTSATTTTTTEPSGDPYADVPSNFDRSQYLSYGHPLPQDMSWEPSGAFRILCDVSHYNNDDPIVYPGQPGAAHRHVYFGNTATDAHSTYRSLRTTGNGTCDGGPLNRTGYWMPAMFNGAGQVKDPDFFQVYYKSSSSTYWIQRMQEFPNGLRIVAGYDAANPSAPTFADWSCNGADPKSATIPNCPAGTPVIVNLRFPMCSDGRVDSPDHRSHMAFAVPWGFFSSNGCPSSHPIYLPEISLIAYYTSDGNSDDWYLSSDRHGGMNHPNGSTFHSDWFGAWDNDIQTTWTQECLREMRSCSGGALGDGSQLEG